MSTPVVPGPKHGRPRDEQLRLRILQAAGETLIESGMPGFTIEGVAARAGASKVTLYKWWPGKGALALDGFAHVVASDIAYPETADPAADLVAQVRSLISLLRDTGAGRAIAQLIGQAQGDPAMSQALRDYFLYPRRELGRRAVRRLVDAGSLPASLDTDVALDQIYGGLYHRLLFGHEPLTDDLAATLVGNLLGSVPRPDDAGGASGRPRTAELLDLEPHPEGGWYRRTWRADTTVTLPGPGGTERVRPTGTLIHFLLEPGESSVWHVVDSDEIWLWHGPGTLRLRLGGSGPAPDPDGEVVVLGRDLAAGQHVQGLVPAGTWQRTEPGATEVLVSCVVSPGFDFADFHL